MTTARTTDNEQIVIRKVHLSLWLRWAKKQDTLRNTIVWPHITSYLMSYMYRIQYHLTMHLKYHTLSYRLSISSPGYCITPWASAFDKTCCALLHCLWPWCHFFGHYQWHIHIHHNTGRSGSPIDCSVAEVSSSIIFLDICKDQWQRIDL